MEENCVFCKIIMGEIPSFTVYEDDDFKVILDRFPSIKGHMLILPKKHMKDVTEFDAELGTKLFEVEKRMVNLLKEKFNPEGINILQNNGEVAGQSVFHYHVHIIPRYEGDDIKIGWTPKQLEISELEEHYNELMK